MSRSYIFTLASLGVAGLVATIKRSRPQAAH